MKILRQYSESYKEFIDLLTPFLEIDSHDQLIDKVLESEGKTSFGEKAYFDLCNKTFENAIKVMKDALNDKSSKTFMFLGADVFMNVPLSYYHDRLGNADFLFSDSVTGINADFWLAKIKPETIRILEDSLNNVSRFPHIEAALQSYVRSAGLIIDKMSPEECWNYGYNPGGGCWAEGQTIHFPDYIKSFHASFVNGQDNKIKILKLAIRKYKR